MHPRFPPSSPPVARALPAWLVLWAAGSLLPGCGVAEDIPAPGGGTAGIVAAGSTSTGMSPTEQSWAMDVFSRTNEERAKAGLPPLAWHEGAAAVAKTHCDDMDVRDFFAHINPEGFGPGGRLTAGGVAWRNVGENLARGYDDTASVVAGWMASDGHRINILHEGVTHLGVGVRLASGGPWYTQVFLTPR